MKTGKLEAGGTYAKEKDSPVSVRPGLQQLEGGAAEQAVNEGAGQEEAPPWPSPKTPANQTSIQSFCTRIKPMNMNVDGRTYIRFP